MGCSSTIFRMGFFEILMLVSTYAFASPTICKPTLWPTDANPYAPSLRAPPELNQLRERTQALRNWQPAPISTIRSAGMIDRDDPLLIQSRRAFQDADAAATLALAYARLGEQDENLAAVERILLAWAQQNVPSGHPIDETRLDGLIWAYDLVSCKLPKSSSAAFTQWLVTWRAKKEAWKFGPRTRHNNHRTHHLKILILIDKVLGDQSALEHHRAEVEEHLKINLPADTGGASLDYKERDALYYHVFNLEAWLEIQLQLRCCEKPISHAYLFLAEKLRSGETHGEFLNSAASIDVVRANAGFEYVQAGAKYDIRRAARVIIQYHTVTATSPDPTLWSITQTDQVPRNLLFYFLRREIWRRAN